MKKLFAILLIVSLSGCGVLMDAVVYPFFKATEEIEDTKD